MRILACVGIVALAASSAFAQVRVVGAGSVNELVGSSRLVTVVLSDGLQDANLKVTGVGPSFVEVESENGEANAYLFRDVRELRVQDAKVDGGSFDFDAVRAMRPEERRIVARATDRAREVFLNTSDQGLRLDAAMLLAQAGDAEAKAYLTQLADGNDLRTALEAGLRLYAATGQIEGANRLISEGFASGDRQVRGLTARLAGLVGDQGAWENIAAMLRDRTAELSTPAARAAALLDRSDALPTLFDMLTGLNEERAKAAVWALSRLGGDAVISELKQRVPRLSAQQLFRAAQVLHNLGDPMGAEIMERDLLSVPTIERDVAVVLAAEGNGTAMNILRRRLEGRYDEEVGILVGRAEMALALVKGGDRTHVAEIQEMLRKGQPEVEARVTILLGKSGIRSLLPITQPSIESTDAATALQAAKAAVMLGNGAFRSSVLDAGMV